MKFTNKLKIIKVQFTQYNDKEVKNIKVMLYEPFIMQTNFREFKRKREIEKMLNVIQSLQALQGKMIKDQTKIWKSTIEVSGLKRR